MNWRLSSIHCWMPHHMFNPPNSSIKWSDNLIVWCWTNFFGSFSKVWFMKKFAKSLDKSSNKNGIFLSFQPIGEKFINEAGLFDMQFLSEETPLQSKVRGGLSRVLKKTVNPFSNWFYSYFHPIKKEFQRGIFCLSKMFVSFFCFVLKKRLHRTVL